ncbi:ribosome 60S biogenesis N-terminal-domain-containing protein [Cantharellus anzutake]|uniref:ribosome 60S biogenesis N-terminal-domain-containing protein n=1 Tax=Cantharellus anzutake TaxID=1750568 RepID=UPI001907C152|nr:ribosome 60S biogenesis N-terminal-domain-containing protein [Cantharellus anzutake]KAF8331396.1 ribosome 60S biogenesis N-terminal-domain-containing protein [Cantharellus anzutake]
MENPKKKRKGKKSAPNISKDEGETGNTHFPTGGQVRKMLLDVYERDPFLKELKKQLDVHPDVLPLPATDGRVRLIEEWVTHSPGVPELFDFWDEVANTGLDANVSDIISVLASILNFTSHNILHIAHGEKILLKLLDAPRVESLGHLASGHNQRLVTLAFKLLRAMAEFDSGVKKRDVMEAFNWGAGSLRALLEMRSTPSSEWNLIEDPDPRTSFILFMLTFLTPETRTSTKGVFLLRHQEIFAQIFEGLHEDPYEVVQKVLEVAWEGIWRDVELSKHFKLQAFGREVLLQIIKLYKRSDQEGPDPTDVPADTAHSFLVAVCTTPNVGICVRDKGWYYGGSGDDGPDAVDSAEHQESEGSSGDKSVLNWRLAGFLGSLNVVDDQRQRDLALKILRTCPELVRVFWPRSRLKREATLSSLWISSVSFVGIVISMPIPAACFRTVDPISSRGPSTGATFNPTPPPLSSLVENTLPSILTRECLSKALHSSTEPLIKHSTALMLAKCLDKFEEIRLCFLRIERILEEDEEFGFWTRRRIEFEKEMKRRLPDVQMIIQFLPPKSAHDAVSTGPDEKKESETASKTPASSQSPNPFRDALLSEAALRLMWQYHRSLPALMSGTRFNSGQLVRLLTDTRKELSPSPEIANTKGISLLGSLHVLRLLQESDKFAWQNSGLQHTYLYPIFVLYLETSAGILRQTAEKLLKAVLSRTPLFDHDPDEVELWLDSLPRLGRSPSAKSPEGFPLTDERASVLTFLDDSIRRCMQTPYPYFEKSLAMLKGIQTADHDDPSVPVHRREIPSPLFSVILEGFISKAEQDPPGLTSSDVLAIATFVRKLTQNFTCKYSDSRQTSVLVQEAVRALRRISAKAAYGSLRNGLEREIRFLTAGLLGVAPTRDRTIGDSFVAVDDFLTSVESLSEPLDIALDSMMLVDWVRLVDPPLDWQRVNRMAKIMKNWDNHSAAIQEFCSFVDPQSASLTAFIPDPTPDFMESFRPGIFCAVALADFQRSDLQQWLPYLVISEKSPARLTYASRLLLHKLGSNPNIVDAVLIILLNIVQEAKACSIYDASTLVEVLFSDRIGLRSHIVGILESSRNLGPLIREVADPSMIVNHVAPISLRWLEKMRGAQRASFQFSTGLPWLPFLDDSQLIEVFDSLIDSSPLNSGSVVLDDFLASLTTGLLQRRSEFARKALRERLPALVSLPLSASPRIGALVSDILRCHLPPGIEDLEGLRRIVLSEVINDANERWTRTPSIDLQLPDATDIDSTLVGTDQIGANALHLSSNLTFRFVEWVRNKPSDEVIERHLKTFHAILDSCSIATNTKTSKPEYPHLNGMILPLLRRLRSESLSLKNAGVIVECLLSIFRLHPSQNETLIGFILDEVQAPPQQISISVHFLLFLYRLLQTNTGEKAQLLLNSVINRGLEWVVRRFSEDDEDSPETLSLLDMFGYLLEIAPDVQAPLADPVLTAGVKNRLWVYQALQFMAKLATRTKLKPVASNRLLQSVLHHPDFPVLTTARKRLPSENDTRSPITSLLHALFFMHPENSCQPTHVAPLIGVYGGTLSTSDRKIISILRLFERERRLSVMAIVKNWNGSSGPVSHTSVVDAITNLDPEVVMRTCLTPFVFGEPSMHSNAGRDEGAVYEPQFIISLLNAASLEGGLTGSQWAQVFQTNAPCIAVRALSSDDESIRASASLCLATLLYYVESADFRERDETIYVLNLLRNIIPPASPNASPPRVTTYVTLIVAHALRSIYNPSHFIYPMVMRFLLQQPTLDDTSVPLLFRMLYSTNDSSGKQASWKLERGWIIRFIADGMISTQDWTVFSHRHQWDRLAGIFQTPETDQATRRGILNVLVRLSLDATATSSLVRRFGLLSWIQTQLHKTVAEEVEIWLEILGNISRVLESTRDAPRIPGAWGSSVAECLGLILGDPSITLRQLLQISIVIKHISPINMHIPTTQALLDSLRRVLERLEPTISTSDFRLEEIVMCGISMSKTEREGHALRPSTPDLWIWGRSIEIIWQSLMVSNADERRHARIWRDFTCRLLIWSSINQDSEAGKWAKDQVIKNMHRSQA